MAEREIVSVFLIDDNAIFLSIVKRFLQSQDAVIVVGATASGEEALIQIQNLQPDVVLVDPFTPKASGLRGVSRLRATAPGTWIVVTGLLDIDDYRQAVLTAGADDFVSKASLAFDLLPAIRRAANGHRAWGDPAKFGEMSYAPIQTFG
jgi:DNA-binding NarL/FixJ family response regulator